MIIKYLNNIKWIDHLWLIIIIIIIIIIINNK